MSQLYYYVIPSTLTRGRWLAVYRLPGVDQFEAPVADCPSEAAARCEADRMNGQRQTRLAA